MSETRVLTHDGKTGRVTSASEQMFPDLPPHLAQMAYALIDKGLCFLTCPPNCRGACVEAAEDAIRGLPVIPNRSEQ